MTVEKEVRPRREKLKNDPKHIAAARELRDRYLEHINSNPSALPEGQSKYRVCRQIEAPAPRPAGLLEAA